MNALGKILIGVAVAVLAAVIVAIVRRIYRRLGDPIVLEATSDHGLRLRIYTDPEEMRGLTTQQLLGMDPSWIEDVDFYFRESPGGAGPTKVEDWRDWAHERGGLVAGWRHILIIVQATEDRTVLLRPPRVRAEREDPAGGVILSPAKEPGGNGLMVRQFDVDLDQRPPAVKYFPEGSTETPQFAMKKGDSESFVVVAHATHGIFHWTFELPCVVDGQEFNLVSPSHDARFATVGYEGTEAQWWDFANRRWIPAAW